MRSIFVLFTSILIIVLLTVPVYSQTATPPSTGDGSPGNPYQIATLNNLYWITQNRSSWNSCFIQSADIDATTSSTWNGGAGFSPIGDATNLFTGLYNGQWYKITNLFIYRTSTDNVGLFGYLSGATIKNVKLEGVNITGHTCVGALSGQIANSSILTYSCSSGSVAGGGMFVGGLVGDQNYSSVGNCCSTASVTGGSYVGGLIGQQNFQAITTNCFSSGSVSASTERAGGLIGSQSTSSNTTNCCYSTASVTGGSNVGGLIGISLSTATSSFWDTQTSGCSTSAGGTGKSTSDMKSSSTFINAGWNASIWYMDGGFNNGYSYLGWQNPGGSPLPVELTSFSASVTHIGVRLQWETSMETNNYGFEVQRKEVRGASSPANWGKVGFVQGNGTSNVPHNYSYTDGIRDAGQYSYRLKQIDRNGAFKCWQETDVTVEAIKEFLLGQNYPDPFNPTTTIQFTVPSDGRATLKVYNTLGQEVSVLFDGQAAAGTFYQVQFKAFNLANGVYFSRLEFEGKVQIKKMVLLK